MDRFEASIPALDHLRGGLLSYRGRMADAMDAADSEIRRIQADLEASEDRWRRELSRRNAAAQNCHRAAIAAAAAGGFVDCTSYTQALRQAEQEVARIVAARDRLGRAADRYRSVRLDYAEVLESGLSRAGAYLDACIAGFVAYRGAAFSHPALQGSLRASGAPAAAQSQAPDAGGQRGGSPEGLESPERREAGPESKG